MMTFTKATKRATHLRLALIGPAGSGKTYSALAIAAALDRRVALIDTEHGSASKYANLWNFDTLELDTFHPQTYMDAIRTAESARYDVLILDSLSHAWSGKDGALELVDRAARKLKTANTFAAWRDITPLHNQLVNTILGAQLHIIATMRTKMEYAQERDEKGRTVIRKIGLAPVQRDGIEYEFDVVGDLDLENVLTISKSRCPALTGAVIAKPGAPLAQTLAAWLSDGAPVPPTPPADDRTARLEKLRALRGQEAALLKGVGKTQTPIDGARVKMMATEEIEALIEQTDSNVMDLKAAQRNGAGR